MNSGNKFVKKVSTPVDYQSTRKPKTPVTVIPSRMRAVGKAVHSRATHGISGVARLFGISQKSATILSAVTLLSGVGTVGAAFLPTSSNDMALFYIGDDECVDYIKEAAKETGAGEQQIPEPYGTTYTVTISSIEDGVPICWKGGTTPARWQDSCKTTFEKWRDTGEKDDGGIITINGYYLVACTKKFGEVGDQVDFFLDDGTKIPCLVADTKNENDAGCNEWGHDGGKSLIEWQVTKKFYDSHPGDWADGMAEHPEWRGKRVASWTNNGNKLGGTGVLGGAASASMSTKRANGQKGIEECQAKRNFDNSTLAAAAVSYSYSQRKTFAERYPGTMLYDEVFQAVLPGDEYYRSCDRGVAAAVKWSGADDDFHYGGCADEYTHMAQSSLWAYVDKNNADKTTNSESGAATYNFGGSASDSKKWAEDHLQPGDVLCTVANEHTFMYVGADAVDQGYSEVISGTDGDVGTPEDTAVFMSASIGATMPSTRWTGPGSGRAPCIQSVSGDGRTYYAFRYIGDYPDKDKYEDVGTMATLTGTKKGGTKCDCVKEEEDLTCGEQMAKRALELSASAVNTKYLTTEMCQEDGVYITDPKEGYADLVNANMEFDSNGHLVGRGNLDVLGSGELHIKCSHPTLRDGKPATHIPHARIYGLEQTKKFIDWQDTVCIPGNYQNADWFCSCSPWVAGVLRELEFDEGFKIAAADQTDYALAHPDKFEVIAADPDKSIDEQCQPGDILNDPTVHTAMYVGNELASKMYPGCSGNVCEAGEFSHRWLSVRKWDHLGSGYSIIRYRCPDGSNSAGRLNDGTISNSQKKLIDAAKTVQSPPAGYCATWISMIYSKAFGIYPTGNACDMYDAWCTSSNESDLKPGMIIAVSTHTLTPNGRRYGHVGIYIGDGKVMDSVGEIRTMSLEKWKATYQTTVPAKWGWIDGRVLN